MKREDTEDDSWSGLLSTARYLRDTCKISCTSSQRQPNGPNIDDELTTH